MNTYWNTCVKDATGNSQLEVDGSYGPNTKAAVKAVQIKVGSRDQDGLYTADTAHAIYSYWQSEKRRMSNFPSAVAEYEKRIKAIPTAMYAKGTSGTRRDEWAITDEPWLGDELTMYATPQGTLSYMRAGSTVVPADLTKELIDMANIGVDGLSMPKFDSGINLMSSCINKPEFNLSFDALVKAEKITEDTLPELKKFVSQEINNLVKQMNYAIKGYAR